MLGDGVKWFRTAAEYRALAISTYRAATEAANAAAKAKGRDSWAVVLDVDETVLDNSVFQRDLSKGTAPFSEELWAIFVHQRSAVPVPGAKAFLDRVKELGGRIVLVTNRFENLCEDTRENLRAVSIPFDAILCRATTGTNTGDKNPRFEAAATGAALGDHKAREVVAFVGDNILDFPALKQSLRDEPESAYEAFGKRYFVLPNPMYGSWQQVPAR
jgi:5'-nucleotidase (lipoprotein e(P4) family)